MKITILSGSPRINSVTVRVALHLKNWFNTNTTHEIELIEMKDWNLPPVQTVWSTPDKAPAEFQSLAQRIFSSDAFILVTPEYNGSYSPALKICWIIFPSNYINRLV